MEKLEELKQIVADNLVYYRKTANLTQLELAEKLNYSDKAISKWERGETLPDTFVLKQIAEIYEITVNDLIEKRKPERKIPFSLKKAFRNRHFLITLLSVGLVLLIACTVFVTLAILNKPKAYMCFIYALPVCSIICFILANLWTKKWVSGLFATLFIWSLAVSVYLTFNTQVQKLWLIFIICIPIQAIVVIWYFLIKQNIKIKWQLWQNQSNKKNNQQKNEMIKNEMIDMDNLNT